MLLISLLKYKWSLLVLFFGMLVSSVLSHKIQHDNAIYIQQALQKSLDLIVESTVTRVELYQYGLRGARGAIKTAGEKDVTSTIFYNYSLTRDIDIEFPGALGFGFIRRVPTDKTEPFLAKAKADGRADFRIKELSPNAGERYVIEYVEPVERNFAALGLDIASEQNRYQAAYSAMQSGEVRLTGPITLVQAEGSLKKSFLMLLPLYRDITLPNSVAEREVQAFGWSYAPLIIDDVLANLGILDNDHFVLDIYDVTDPNSPERFFSNYDTEKKATHSIELTHQIYGRNWQFDLTAKPDFVSNANLLSPTFISFLGIIASLIMSLLAGFIEANYKNKRRLIEQQGKLVALVESSADGIIAITLDGIVTSWNKGAERLFGYTAKEAINKNLDQLIINQPFKHQHRVILKQVAQGKSLSSVHTLRHRKDGSSIDVSITVSPIYSDEGVVIAVSKTVRDISAQKVAEAKIRELNESLEYQVFERTSEIASLNTLFEHVLMAASDFAIVATDLEGNIQLFNRGAEHLLGYQAEDMVGKKTPLAFHSQKELTDRYASSFDQPNAGPVQDFQILLVLAQKNSEYQEWHYTHKDGYVIDVKLVMTQMLDEKGKISGYLFIAVDITEQKRKQIELLTTQRQLLSRTEQLMMVYDVAELGIWELILEDNSLIWNNKMFEFYEQPTSLNQCELNYSHWESRIHPEDRQHTTTRLLNAVNGRGSFDSMFRLLLPSGKLRYIQGGAYIQRNAQGEAVRVVGINRDITAQREFESQLRESKKIADTANAAKSMFLANMSHEIRTPMNAVLGMLQLIRTTELSIQQDNYTDKAQTAAKSLLKLIDDTLDFSKIESNKLELEKYPFTTNELLTELAAVLTPNLGNKNVELLFDIDPLLPDSFEGDRQRLQQVLINLANNAIKFTDHGEIVVKIERLQLQGTTCSVRFNVMDTGIGISQTQQQTVFEIFTQSEISTSRKYGGSGLGLAISKRIVLLMGGEIQLQSEVGKGSHFWFDVELCVAETRHVKETVSPFLSQDKNVLIVNTNDTRLSILKSTVESCGPNVVMARSGEKAVQHIDSSIAKKTMPQAVFIEYQMQGMSGLEATQHIKARAETKDTPVFIMVAELRREELIKQLNNTPMPCVTYVAKPITPHQMAMMLERTLSDSCPTSPNRIKPTPSAFPLKGVRLLLVEDNEFNRIIASELLEHEGAIVDIATGGQRAINTVLNGLEKYDLVLMDMQMPVIDGLEATRQIRANAQFSNLPIIAMTANVSLSDKRDCLKAGMNGHIGKPFILSDVIETILSYTQPTSVVSTQTSVLNHREEKPLAPRSTQNTDLENVIALNNKNDSIVKTLEPVLSEPALHGIQFEQKTLETLLEPLSCDAAFYQRLLGIFEQNFTNLMLTLQEKIDQKAYQEAAAVLHSLKGSSGTIGLTTLHSVICEAESQFKQTQQAPNTTPDLIFTDLIQRLNFIASHELTLIYPLLPDRTG